MKKEQQKSIILRATLVSSSEVKTTPYSIIYVFIGNIPIHLERNNNLSANWVNHHFQYFWTRFCGKAI